MSRDVRADLAGVVVGGGRPVVIMGVVNVSPESFHPGSVYQGRESLVRAALGMVEAGAALIDVGGRSSAPYLATAISEAEEADRLGRAVELLAAKLPVPISADTPRPEPARVALEAGARIVNDVSALREPALARLVAAYGAGLLLMASPPPVCSPRRGRPVPVVATIKRLLAAGLRRAARAGIPSYRIVVDPGVGFFRDRGRPWHVWDAAVVANLAALLGLGRPVGVGVSRKSFIGAIVGRPDTTDRLAGSLAATAVAVLNGAALVRTHDVAQTRDAVQVAERLRDARR